MNLKPSKRNYLFWFDRLAPVLVCLLAFVVFINLYNVWTGLTLFFLVRRTVISISLGVLILAPALFFRKNKTRSIYLLIISTLFSILLVVNFTYSKYAGGFLSVSALKYAKHLFAVSGSVKTLLSIKQLLLLTPIFIAIILMVFFKDNKSEKTQLTRKELAVLLSLVILIITSGLGYLFYKEYKEWGSVSRLIDHPYNSDDLVRKVGIINYGIFDVTKYATRKKNLSSKEVEQVNSIKQNIETSTVTNAYTGLVAGKNIIYVQLESFQNFLIGKKINDQAITPNLNQLASRSNVFTNFHYQVGPGTSSDSEFTMLNSLYHLGDKSVNFEYPGNNLYAMPKFLKENGYSTVAMHGDSPNFWNRGNIFANFGYEKFVTLEQYMGEHILWGLNDADFFSQSADKLKSYKQPFFAHLISLSSHSPFKLPQKYQTLKLEDVEISQLQKDYLQAAHYTDEAFGKLIEKLKENNLYDNTTVIVSGDHEGFIAEQNDKKFAKFLGLNEGFDDLSYLAFRQVPFIIHLPGQTEQKLIDTPAGHINIYPTIANLIGKKIPNSLLGQDIFGQKSLVVTTRKRSLGQNIEMIISQDLVYISGGSDFNSGRCYAQGQLVDVNQCKSIYDHEVKKMFLSDKVIEGNRLDLLKN